jgi:hypothetical protein
METDMRMEVSRAMAMVLLWRKGMEDRGSTQSPRAKSQRLEFCT